MNRNRNKAIELLFDIIKIRFDLSSSVLPSDFYQSRWIQGKALEEDWLTHCDFKSALEIAHEKQFAILEYQNNLYFVATGLEDPDNIPIGVSYFPLNSGLFTAVVTELELPVKSSVTDLQLEQNILSQSTADSLYQGHDMIDLIPIFPNIFVGEITNQYVGDPHNLPQLVCSYIALNKKFVALPFSQSTLDKINDLVLLNSKILSYDNIIQCLLTSHFKYSFLDLYRCIEMLYQIIYVDDTHAKLALTIDKTDFLLAIDENLSWRPNERNALKKIFCQTPGIYMANLNQAIRAIDHQIKSYSDWLYDLRCNVVHLKSAQKKFNLKHHGSSEILVGFVCYA
jgi:hypothetical protein